MTTIRAMAEGKGIFVALLGAVWRRRSASHSWISNGGSVLVKLVWPQER
jgi:hypothetical protein